MKNLIKTSIILTLTALSFQSCESEETVEVVVSEEQSITTNLSEKIIATADSLNDYNFFTSNAAKSDCGFLKFTNGYFNNPEGDYFSFTLSDIESLDMWLTQYNAAKLEAFNTTGVEFTDEDFFINYLLPQSSGFLDGLSLRESILYYFENCEIIGFGDTPDYGIPFNDISLDCNNLEDIILSISDDNVVIGTIETSSLLAVEDLLASYNFDNNTDYGLENLRIISFKYLTPNGEELLLRTTKELTNYFKDCKFSRDASTNDCLNFVYPFNINRFSLQLEEVITTTIENDEDLIETFSIDVGELGFVFPISLIGQNGTVLEITTNAALEEALDNSADYCN